LRATIAISSLVDVQRSSAILLTRASVRVVRVQSVERDDFDARRSLPDSALQGMHVISAPD